MKKYLLTAFACLCIAASGIIFTSCFDDGMNDGNMLYSYRASSTNINYSDAPGYFTVAIRDALGTTDEVWGGEDDKVIEACDKCYDELKPKLEGKVSGTVVIYKVRHSDGKRKDLKKYKF